MEATSHDVREVASTWYLVLIKVFHGVAPNRGPVVAVCRILRCGADFGVLEIMRGGAVRCGFVKTQKKKDALIPAPISS